MEGNRDCMVSFIRWQKLTEINTRYTVPSWNGRELWTLLFSTIWVVILAG
jgi:hypothetical protein